jgi:STIM1 Orai1-activating region
MEVKQDLQERMMRWRQIESLCGFPITTNPGYNYLETLLRSGLNSSRYVVLNSSKSRTISYFLPHSLDINCILVVAVAATSNPTAGDATIR